MLPDKRRRISLSKRVRQGLRIMATSASTAGGDYLGVSDADYAKYVKAAIKWVFDQIRDDTEIADADIPS